MGLARGFVLSMLESLSLNIVTSPTEIFFPFLVYDGHPLEWIAIISSLNVIVFYFASLPMTFSYWILLVVVILLLKSLSSLWSFSFHPTLNSSFINLIVEKKLNYVSVFHRMGRDIAYDCWSCDLLCAASSPDLYRINLEQVFLANIVVVVLAWGDGLYCFWLFAISLIV